MSKLILSINMSLDGFAGHTDFAATVDDELHGFFSDLLDSTDIVLFGRVTYQLMESYWPHAHQDPKATKSMLDFADRYNAISKIVFSRTLQQAGWNNSRLVRDNMVEEVVHLKELPGKNLLLDGINISREFMRRGLIDEYRVVVHPVVVGTGRRLFDNLNERINLRLVNTKVFKSGVVVLHYLNERK